MPCLDGDFIEKTGGHWSDVVLLFAVAAASAGQSAILAFLPTLVNGGLGALSAESHNVHIASLTATHPLAALLAAPLWGWLAERFDYRILLRAGLIVLAFAMAPVGIVSLQSLYLLRIFAGIATAAIVPLALLAATFAAKDRTEQATRFTWLTGFVFVGEIVGPLLAEGSSSVFPETPLLIVALAIALIFFGLCAVHLPARCAPCPDIHPRAAPPLSVTAILLAMALIGSAGLSSLHVNLLLTRAEAALSRETIALMLSLCGLGMLGAQLFHARTSWLVQHPRRLACLSLLLLAITLIVFPLHSGITVLGGVIVTAGWSAASIRLLTGFWVSGSGAPSSSKLGFQYAAASVGQAVAPVFFAVTAAQDRSLILWSMAALLVLLLLALPLLWKPPLARATVTV